MVLKGVRPLKGGMVIAGLVLAVLGISTIWYMPHYLYLAYKLGLTRAPAVNGVVVSMGSGWFPALDSASWFGRKLIEGSARVVLFYKIDGIKPGISQDISIGAVNVNGLDARAICGRKNFKWGNALIVCPKLSKNPMIVLPDFKLGLISSDERSFDDVAQIRLLSRPGSK